MEGGFIGNIYEREMTNICDRIYTFIYLFMLEFILLKIEIN